MRRDAAEILRDALALPTDTRAALVDSGAVKTVPWVELRSRLIAKLGNDRGVGKSADAAN